MSTDYTGSPVHGAMSLVYRAPNGDEVYVPADDFGNVSNQPTDEGLGERVLARMLAVENQPDGTETPWHLSHRDDQGNVVVVPARPLERIEFNVTVTQDGSSTHCYGTDAADGSGLINQLRGPVPKTAAELYQNIERTAEQLIECGAFSASAPQPRAPVVQRYPGDDKKLPLIWMPYPDESPLIHPEDDGDLQEGNARWLRHTVDLGRGSTQHIQAPDASKRTGGKMRWSAAIITALIALVVAAALCADIFAVPWTPSPIANGDAGCIGAGGELGCVYTSESLTEFVPDLPRRMWIGPVVPVGFDCRYFGKTTALRNWAQMQCIDAQFHAGDVRP